MCLNHGLHLAVCNTFYLRKRINDDQNISSEDEAIGNSEEDEFEDNFSLSATTDEYAETEAERVTEIFKIAEILNKVRVIVKFFKSSTVRNDILQAKVRIELEHELHLVLDVKHRWNSIYPMLESF